MWITVDSMSLASLQVTVTPAVIAERTEGRMQRLDETRETRDAALLTEVREES